MNIINQNPYRQLGVYANSSKKEQLANEGKIKAFLKVKKQVAFPLDLNQYLLKVERSAESVADAMSKLTLPKDQMRYAQFWFINVTPLDKIAFNHLTSGNMDVAIQTWKKKDCASSLHNRIVCALINTDYGSAITLAERLYSQYKQPFVTAVLGATALASTDTIEYDFIDTLSEEAGLNTILSHVTNADWKNHLSAKAINPLIDQLQAAVEASKATRGKGPEAAAARMRAGNKLWKTAKPLLKQLAGLLPKTDLKYQMIADKVGTEILQCSIDYYNDSEDDDKAFKAMTMLKHAKSILVGEMAKQRCNENEEALQNIIDQLPPQEVLQEDKDIKAAIVKVLISKHTIDAARNLLNTCKPALQAIKSKLGDDNKYYLKTSTMVVNIALGNIIQEVNEVQNNGNVAEIGSTVRSAWEVTRLMDSFDMEEDFKTGRYNQNRSILKNICGQLGISTSPIVPRPKPISQPRPKPIPQPQPTSDDDDDMGCIIFVIIFIIAVIVMNS